MARVIELYNGHTHKFYADPIKVDGDLVKLASAEGRYLTAWKHKSVLQHSLSNSGQAPEIVPVSGQRNV